MMLDLLYKKEPWIKWFHRRSIGFKLTLGLIYLYGMIISLAWCLWTFLPIAFNHSQIPNLTNLFLDWLVWILLPIVKFVEYGVSLCKYIWTHPYLALGAFIFWRLNQRIGRLEKERYSRNNNY